MYREKWSDLVQMLIANRVSSQVLSETIEQLSRQESRVKWFEAEHQVHVKWEPQMEEYQEALKIVNCGKQRVFYLSTHKYHAGGQKQASRVSKVIQLCTHKVKQLLQQYKTLQVVHGENLQLGVVEVLDLESSFWRTEHSYSTTTPCDRLPANSQRRLLELSSLR